jgi:hypothetical protein
LLSNAFLVQMVFALGTGAPIFVLFPLLIYGPKAQNAVMSRIRWLKRLMTLRLTERNGTAVVAVPNGLDRTHRVPSVFSEWEGSIGKQEFKRGLYWRHRFVFAVLLWMSCVSFISADFAMQSAPIPGIACYLTVSNEWRLKADSSLFCFSNEMGRSHLAGSMLALAFTIVFPSVIYSKINRISNLHLWDNADYAFQMGYFYGPFKTAWCYLFVMNHLQFCVFVTVLNLVLWQDEIAMLIAPMSLNAFYVAFILFVRPYESRLDNILEAVFYTICAFGSGLGLLQMHDPNNMFIDVRTPLISEAKSQRTPMISVLVSALHMEVGTIICVLVCVRACAFGCRL